LLERLKDADRQDKKINLVYGKDELKPDEKSKLKQLNNLSLHFSKDLHAKCYYNEKFMVIASMNLHEYSQQHNKEMGVLLSLEGDPDAFNEALNEADSILWYAEKYSPIRSILSKDVKAAKSIADSTTETEPKRPKRNYYLRRKKQPGFCIRCGISIPYNLNLPYCRNCGSEWKAKGGNPDQRERHGKCHACGKPWPATKRRPLCDACYDRPRR